VVAAVPAASVSILAQWIIRKRQIRLHWKIGAREIERILVVLRHEEERCYLASAIGELNAHRCAGWSENGEECAVKFAMTP